MSRAGHTHALCLVAAAGGILASAAGCTYLRHRGRDLADVVWLDAGYGIGAGVDLQVTSFVHTGIGVHELRKAGLARRTLETWKEHGVGLLLFRYVLYGEHFTPEQPHPGERRGYILNATGLDVLRRRGDDPIPTANATAPWLNLFDADVGLALLVVGGRVGVSPGELLDFLLGWFGLDIGRDDGAGPSRGAVVNEELAALLFWAIDQGDFRAVQLALRGDPGLANATSRTTVLRTVRLLRWRPLHLAAAKDERRIARLLIRYRADLESTDARGRTPLHVAATWGRRNVTELLIELGADVRATDRSGKTPLELAEERGHTAVADLLRRHGPTK